MGIVEAVLKKIQILPLDQQKAVLEFADFLVHKNQLNQTLQPSAKKAESLKTKPEESYVPKSTLGKSLYEIRQKGINAGIELLTAEEIDSTISEHRRYHIAYEDVS